MVLVIRPKAHQRRVERVICTSRSFFLDLASPSDNSFHQYRVVALQMQRQLGDTTEFAQVMCILQRARESIQQHALAGATTLRCSNAQRNDGVLYHLLAMISGHVHRNAGMSSEET
jgi:hypothetical protein